MKTFQKLTLKDKADVLLMVRSVFAKLGYPTLAEKTEIHWRQMYRDVGASEWRVRKPDGTVISLKILFSAKLWPYMSRKQRYDTIVHEVCHIVDVHLGNIYGDPHGPSWSRLMRKMGVTPKPSLRQLNISYEEMQKILPKCSICREIGHNKLYCPDALSEHSDRIYKRHAK